jgi:hypothetical protein
MPNYDAKYRNVKNSILKTISLMLPATFEKYQYFLCILAYNRYTVVKGMIYRFCIEYYLIYDRTNQFFQE